MKITCIVLNGTKIMTIFFVCCFVSIIIMSVYKYRYRSDRARKGFTLFELIFALAILATLAALSALIASKYMDKADYSKAITDIQSIQDEITLFQMANNRLPLDLSAIDMDSLEDPWGNPYQYTNFSTTPKGHWRKDKFMVPINSTFDLCSMGPDGVSQTPLTAEASRDDIIRANDGSFVGKASDY